ncbi:Ethylmalonyl-CoA/methylmalonyl-CoA epimerase [Sporomusa carbonis]|uniref:VOC family protein n=1 Tax=Sporomusa carbonis TaxID=3076075 RepID=UPI003A62BC87
MYNVAHTGIVVKDADKSSRFYQRILGCELVNVYQDERVKLIFLNAAGQTIELVQFLQSNSQERTGGGVNHIAFKVGDITAAIDELRAAGVKLLSDDPGMLKNGMQNIFFLGPDDERLEFMQEAAR